MNYSDNHFSKGLAQQLDSLEQAQFTGKLEVKSTLKVEWRLYFALGRLIWADGTEHPYRSWQRHLSKYCSDTRLRRSDITEAVKFECWNYYILTLLSRRKTMTREELIALVKNNINEILFDILQKETTQEFHYIHKPESLNSLLASGLKISLVLVNVKSALAQAQELWTAWCEKGLRHISPNLAPSLKKPEQLQQEVSAQVYQNLFQSIDSGRTLRDLSVQMNHDILQLTCSLVSYISNGLIELNQIPDLPELKTEVNSELALEIVPPKLTAANKPIIACVDDSHQTCLIMDLILKKGGYKFIGIPNPLQALPILISSNPSLIFLDIAMPIVNGYEVCAQLRRVSKFKEIPIIMLTGNDGIVDRVRAKLVGASGFIAKPIEITKIIKTLEKFLPSGQDDQKSQIYNFQPESEQTLTTV
jgi:two-component system, chemotaxis family, response regulator PixG